MSKKSSKIPRKGVEVDPPSVYPGGLTWVDEEYDARFGGAEQEEFRSPQRSAAENAIADLFPEGVPSPAKLSNKELTAKVATHLKAQNIRVPSNHTIERAAGRRR
jgi:hypothetical protein